LFGCESFVGLVRGQDRALGVIFLVFAEEFDAYLDAYLVSA